VVAVPRLTKCPMSVFTGGGVGISRPSTKLPNTKDIKIQNSRLKYIISIPHCNPTTDERQIGELKERREE